MSIGFVETGTYRHTCGQHFFVVKGRKGFYISVDFRIVEDSELVEYCPKCGEELSFDSCVYVQGIKKSAGWKDV